MFSLFFLIIIVFNNFDYFHSYQLRKSYNTNKRAEQLYNKLLEFQKLSDSIILIDGDNVRGKTKFLVSKEQLIDDLKLWTEDIGLSGRVVCYFDHAAVYVKIK